MTLGHRTCLQMGMYFDREDTELFMRCITADGANLEELKEEGIDTTWSSKAMSSVRVCRDYLKKLGNNKKLNGSTGGGAKVRHFGNMLYFMTQFYGRKQTSRICSRELSCDVNKLRTGNRYVALNHCYVQPTDPMQDLLGF